MTTNLFLDFLGILMDAHKADGMAFTINLVTPDNGEQFVIELSNNTLTNIEGYQAEDADLTLTITRLGLAQAMIGAKPLLEQIESGDAKAEGDAGVLKQLASTFVRFDPRFEILPGTAGAPEEMNLNDFEVGPVQIHGEWILPRLNGQGDIFCYFRVYAPTQDYFDKNWT